MLGTTESRPRQGQISRNEKRMTDDATRMFAICLIVTEKTGWRALHTCERGKEVRLKDSYTPRPMKNAQCIAAAPRYETPTHWHPAQ